MKAQLYQDTLGRWYWMYVEDTVIYESGRYLTREQAIDALVWEKTAWFTPSEELSKIGE